jgi:hypothetical protein
VGITCIGNLAVFFSCLIRGRLHVEMGARDLLATITGSKLRELKEENEYVLTTIRYSEEIIPDVVMLSNHTPESSIRQFMEYIKNTHDVKSTLLRFHVAAEICIRHRCMCIVIEGAGSVFWLARRMPGVLKQLSFSKWLLPCVTCLRNGCHGCNPKWPVPAVCEILDKVVTRVCEERSCICIPTKPAEDDKWTNMLIRSLKTKDKADRGVRNPASDALGKYISQSGVCDETEKYSTVPLIVPRLAEVLINIILTGWFRVDGFSTALVARRVIRDYIVDSRGSGIAANVFLKECEVHSNAENTDVCQVLTFRGNLVTFRSLSSIIGCVNLICSISWAVLIAIPAKWYDTLSMPPSKATIVILIAAIGIAFVMDCLQMYLYRTDAIDEEHGGYASVVLKFFFLPLWLVMILEMVCIISGSAILATLGIKGFGRWTYSAIQLLVWVKWGLGSYLLRVYSYDDYTTRLAPWAFDVSAGHGLMCASAFLLNAILVGVRGQWKYSQS